MPADFHSRRNFLKASALAAAGLVMGSQLALPSGARGADGGVKKSVIVIGAGISGLAAAQKLTAAGFEVTVLEGRDRIGGRIVTDRSQRFAADMGATWILGPDGNPISDLAQKARARTIVTPEESVSLFDSDGDSISSAKLAAGQGRYTQLLSQLDKAIASDGPDISLAEAINKIEPRARRDTMIQWKLATGPELFAGGPIERLSDRHWNSRKRFEGKDVILPDGFDALVTLLATSVNVKLGETVKTIDYDASGVTIQTSKSIHHADYAIVTLPLGVLKAKSVKFTPPLPAEKTDAMNRLQMGSLNKVILFFDHAFWPVDVQFLGFASPDRSRFPLFMNCRTFSEANMLVAFCTGTSGAMLESHSDVKIENDVMDVLRTMYPIKAISPIKTIVTRWTQDRFSRGSSTIIPAGASPDDLVAMGQPVNDRLFFAGEHTSPEYRGTVHGAYLSGIREADRIVALG